MAQINAIGLRTTLWGLALAFTSTALPFAIWNMNGGAICLSHPLVTIRGDVGAYVHPPMVIFFFLQRYLVSGLAVGGVKG